MIKKLRTIFAVLLCTVWALPIAAHEFWIESESYQIPTGGTIRAEFRNGEEFAGVQLAYFERSSKRLQVVSSGGLTDLTPRNGDRPAIALQDLAPGLYVLAHETSQSRIKYAKWEKWLKFAAHKDFPDIEARHATRGLPQMDFYEGYTRHAKALVAVGDGQGSDTALGMATEFVALDNPYTIKDTSKVRVNLFYNQSPRSDAQVEVFERAPDGTVTITLTRTDSMGLAEIPTKPGHDYLLDAVVLRDSEADDATIVWETLWAALTFSVPDM